MSAGRTMKPGWRFCLLIAALLGAGVPFAGAQPSTNKPVVIQAGGFTPDPVATGLMPVPIYNFAVDNVAFSPDGHLLATGDGNGVVRLWDTRTGKLWQAIPAHTNWVFSVAWSADGKFFATGGGDGLVHLFGLEIPGKPFQTLSRQTDDVHALVIAADGGQIMSAGDDHEIYVWSLFGDRRAPGVRHWTAHEKPITTLALGPDGKTLASGSRDHTVKLWELASGRLRDSFLGHAEDVMSVRFSPDGKRLASASYDGTVRLWEVDTGKCLRVLIGHTGRVFSVAFSPDGRWLASAGDSTARIWDLRLGIQSRVIKPGGTIHTGTKVVPENVSAAAYSPDGKLLAVSSTTGMTYLLAADTGKLVWQLNPATAAPEVQK